MPIPTNERQKMLAVRLCGPRVIVRLESIGITKLADLAERNPHQPAHFARFIVTPGELVLVICSSRSYSEET